MKVRIFFLFILLLFVLSCSVKHNGIIVGVKHTSTMQIPVTTAVSAKIINTENVKYLSSNKAVANELEKGKIDLALLPVETLFFHNYKNIKVLKSFIRGGYGILGNVKIKSKEDIKGKTIGVLKKTLGEYLLNNLKDSLKVKIKVYSSQKLMDLDFTYEKIAGMVLTVPQITMKSSLKYRIIFWFTDAISYYPSAVIAVNEKSYEKKQNQIDKLISKFIQIGNEFMGSPDLFFETNEKIFSSTRYKAKMISYQIRFVPVDFASNHKFEKKIYDFMNKKGYVKLKSFDKLVIK